jgi:hypothetical protein
VPQVGDPPDDHIRISALKLAAWLLFNQQALISRELAPDGKIVYLFRHSASMAQLIEAWELGQPGTRELNRFANIASYEIRLSHKMRRLAKDNCE